MTEEARHLAAVNRLREQRLVRRAELVLRLQEILGHVLIAVGALATMVLAVGMAVLLARLGHRWAGASQRSSTDDWATKAYRDARIQMARANERHWREAQSPGIEVEESTAQPVETGVGKSTVEFDNCVFADALRHLSLGRDGGIRYGN
jgi:hypothetical protein